MGRKILKNKHLKFELQELKEEMRSQKEAKEMVEKLHSLKKLEVPRHIIEVVTQEL